MDERRDGEGELLEEGVGWRLISFETYSGGGWVSYTGGRAFWYWPY